MLLNQSIKFLIITRTCIFVAFIRKQFSKSTKLFRHRFQKTHFLDHHSKHQFSRVKITQYKWASSFREMYIVYIASTRNLIQRQSCLRDQRHNLICNIPQNDQCTRYIYIPTKDKPSFAWKGSIDMYGIISLYLALFSSVLFWGFLPLCVVIWHHLIVGLGR